MAILGAIRSGFASVVSHLPRGRGFGRSVRIMNRVFLTCGCPPLVETRLVGGHRMRLDLRSLTEVEAFYWRRYDTELLEALIARLDADTVFLDVGANVGFYPVPVARFLQQSGGRGRVIAMEPLAANAARLRENLDLNGVLVSNSPFDGRFARRWITPRLLDDLWPEVARRGGASRLRETGHRGSRESVPRGRQERDRRAPPDPPDRDVARGAGGARPGSRRGRGGAAGRLPDAPVARGGWQPARGLDEIGEREDVLFVPEES